MTNKTLRSLLAVVVVGTTPVTVAAQGRPFGPGEAGAAGEALIAAEVTRYGRIRNAEWDQDISSVLAKIEQAVGYPALRVGHVVVGNPEPNAAAVPGGSILVNVGLLRLLRDLAVGGIATSGPQHERFTASLAAVLSHEVAHITLGHTDSLLASLTRLATTAGIPDSSLDNPWSYRSVALDTEVTPEMLEHSRERELDADRVGALYLLRAGWTIQTAMDLFRQFDSLERRDPNFYQSVTYVRSHPRSSTREAGLEAFRARLKLLQADYDDALALIGNNVAVPSAITLLDTVLAYFPQMLPALHARGTAYHQLWLETVPVPVQQVRASLTTYRFRFLPVIRGLPGDLALYRQAKADYTSALSHEPLALTAVQLALLEAYAGDCTSAMRRERVAVISDSLSPSVVNNSGVVLLICGQAADGLQAFKRAQKLVGPNLVPSLLFNTARATKATGNDTNAGALFRQYLTIDATSEWAAEARRQLGAPDSGFASRTGVESYTPQIQGIKLGDPLEEVQRVWGEASAITGDSITVMTYQNRGVKVAVSPESGVAMILVLTRGAGAIDGVRVGDPVAAALSKWGTPRERHDEDQFFDRGSWVVMARGIHGIIAALAILPNH
jgi:metalloendopeptidase OMA1, mitochondrial